MNTIEQIKQESLNEFGSDWTQKKYEQIAKRGFWESEEILINKYFQVNSKILDIGCGSGRTAIALNKKEYEVHGVDITPEMIETAKKISKEEGLKINYQVGDATQLELPDNHFDGAIFANNGWVQIPGAENRQKALNEICRTLKPGAHFILVAHQRYYFGIYIFFWIWQWLRFYILKPLNFPIKEIDFGDLFFTRPYKLHNKKVKQFIHMTSQDEVEYQIQKSGLKLVARKSLGELSTNDAKNMRGSLSKHFNSFKSPIFYICKK